MRTAPIAPAFFITGFLACSAPGLPAAAQTDSDLLTQARDIFSPIPLQPPTLPGNSATPAKLALGKMLFFDPRLSESQAISCNSCHSISFGGADVMETSRGHRWQKSERNSPTVFNAVFNIAQFWDGRAADLKAQASAPMLNPAEMATSHGYILDLLKSIPGYGAAFRAAYPGEAEPVTIDNTAKAIAVFEATLITPNAPFDQFLRGKANALSPVQKEGLKLFMNRGCAVCHNGINLGGGQYAPFGVMEKPGADFLPPTDTGRFTITRTVSDEYVFKVPTLRNIALTAPYFHSGRSWDLRQAVAVMGSSQLGQTLTGDEINKITDFLATLTGEQPQVSLPALPPGTAATPRPKL